RAPRRPPRPRRPLPPQPPSSPAPLTEGSSTPVRQDSRPGIDTSERPVLALIKSVPGEREPGVDADGDLRPVVLDRPAPPGVRREQRRIGFHQRGHVIDRYRRTSSG